MYTNTISPKVSSRSLSPAYILFMRVCIHPPGNSEYIDIAVECNFQRYYTFTGISLIKWKKKKLWSVLNTVFEFANRQTEPLYKYRFLTVLFSTYLIIFEVFYMTNCEINTFKSITYSTTVLSTQILKVIFYVFLAWTCNIFNKVLTLKIYYSSHQIIHLPGVFRKFRTRTIDLKCKIS